MNFTSQICTTEEQSKRLIALGLKAETADMSYFHTVGFEGNDLWLPSLSPYENVVKAPNYGEKTKIYIKSHTIPAWSLHRLIEMCNKTQFGMTIGIYRDEVTVDGDLFEVYDNTYDNLISIIEWLIGLEKFHENYLNIH